MTSANQPLDVESPGTTARRDALDDLYFEGPLATARIQRFATLIMLSAAIAAFGLIADSVAVVIGAMLVAPLMTPILGTAGALVLAEKRRLAVSLLVVLGGAILAVLMGWVMASLVPGAASQADELPGEVLARTEPGLIDLGVAIFAGAAAGYILTRPDVSSALPGVAIAVALVPPLATVGITLQVGAGAAANGALLLFITNFAAIVLTASVVFLLSGFIPVDESRRAWRTTNVSLLIALVTVGAVAVPLGLHTLDVIEDERLRDAVSGAVVEWDPSLRIVSLTVDDQGGKSVVSVGVAGPNEPPSSVRLADLIKQRRNKPIDLRVTHTYEESSRVTIQ